VGRRVGEHRLQAVERRAFEREGFFVRERVFEPEALDALRAAAQRVEALAEGWHHAGRAYQHDGLAFRDVGPVTLQYEHQPGSRALRVVEPVHHLDAQLEALVDDARLVEPLCDWLGESELALFTDKLNLKPAGNGSGFRWHQDAPYWSGGCDHLERLPNVMLALDDADLGNGCFRVMVGSHVQGMLPGCRGPGVLEPLFTDPACLDPGCEVALAVPAGSLIFFDPFLVHGSGPNRSPRARRALVLTYQPPGYDTFKLGRPRPVRPDAGRSPARKGRRVRAPSESSG